MSLLSLPNELLEIIAKYVSAAHCPEQEQQTEESTSSDIGYRVRCEASALVPLASVNKTLRCSSLPTLFSRISVICSPMSWDDCLEAYERMLKSRPHISECVRSLSLCESQGESALLVEGPMSSLCRCLELQPGIRSLSGIHNSPDAAFVASVNNHPSLQLVNVDSLPSYYEDASAVKLQGGLQRFTMSYLRLSSAQREFLMLKNALRLGMCLESLAVEDISLSMVRISELDLSSLRVLDLRFVADKPLPNIFEEWLQSLVARSPSLARISFRDITFPWDHPNGPRWPDTTSLPLYPRLPIIADILSAPADHLQRFFGVHFITQFTTSRRKSLNCDVPGASDDKAWSDRWAITDLTLSCYDSPSPQSLPESMRYLFHNLEFLSLWHCYRDSDSVVENWSLPVHPIHLADGLRECYHLDHLYLRRFDILPSVSFVDGPRNTEAPFSSGLRFLAESLKAAIPSLYSISGDGWHESKHSFWSCGFRRRPDGGFEATTSV